MKTAFLLLLVVLLGGCGDSQVDTFTVESQTAERFGRNASDVASREFATASEVQSVVESIDWTTGETRAWVTIVPSGEDGDNSRLHLQHDLKAHDVFIIAEWKVPRAEFYRLGVLPDPDAVRQLVDTYTRGGDLRGLAKWSNLDGTLDTRDNSAEP